MRLTTRICTVLLLAAVGLDLIVLSACAQDSGSFYHPLTLAPSDASSSGGGASGSEDEKEPISLQLGYRYYAERPAGGPDWGLRFTVTLLFPK